jgi:hypothetical protein
MCLFPQRAEPQEFGRPKFTPEGSLVLPCGKCTECINKRSIEWATRAKHEISLHNENCFITLTYDDAHLEHHEIIYDDFQKFIKKLRRYTSNSIRYMVSCEYGSLNYRPHFHAILFGFNPPEQSFLRKSPKSGEPLFTSKLIGKLWDKGFHSIGIANEKTAFYIASYSLKGKIHHHLNDGGEYIQTQDFMKCSTRPAIGKEYFLKNKEQIVCSNDVLPRYYKKLLERHDPDLLEYHENELLKKFKARGDHELYAKYILDQKKKQLLDNEYRSAPDDSRSDGQYKYHLREKRDAYQKRKKKNV